MKPLAITLSLLAASLPVAAAAQDADSARDAEIARLTRTVEILIQRIEALEAERAPAPATTAPAPAPVPAPAPAPVPSPAVAASPPLAGVPVASLLPDRDTFDEDADAAPRVNNEAAPGEAFQGFFPIAGTSTWLRLSGFAKLDAMYDFDDAGVSDQFVTSAIPVGRQSGQGSFNMHARQTRFTLEARRQTDYGPLRFMLQNDFYGAGGSYGYNLRHAWGQLGNTYVGYGFSAFMDLDSGPDTVDFAGPGVVPFGRVASVRQFFPLGKGNQLILSAEHSGPQVTSTMPGVNARTTAPNLVLAYRHESGSGHMQASALLRQLAYNGDAGRGEKLAGGMAVSGAWGPQDRGYLTWGVVGGEGMASYVNGLTDGVVTDTGSLEAVGTWGGWLGYRHPWSANWRSTLTWGRLYLERNAWLSADAFRRSDYVAANLMYSPAPSWSWGVEVLYGSLQQQGGEDGDVVRVQTALKYDFIK